MSRATTAVLLLALSACSEPEVSQVIVTIDADPEVRAVTRELSIELFGAGQGSDIPRENRREIPIYFVGDEAKTWPVDLALAPLDEDASRRFRIVVTARRGTQFVGQVKAISGYVPGKTLWLRLYIDRFCLYHEECVELEDQTCAGGTCVDALMPAQTLPEHGSDAGVITICESDAECDDGVGCTVDACVAARCTSTADDSACTDGPDGACDPVSGCQYSTCDESTCQPGPCQMAVCVGATCQRTSTCGASQMCCAGACVPDGCSDGNPCTADSCVDTGCVHAPRDMQSCEDGVYCNGGELCAGDACAEGTPRCSGAGLMCDEASAACVGCTVDGDCDPEISMGACMPMFPGSPCNTAGRRTDTTTHYRCSAGECVFDQTTTAMSTCTLVTEGLSCSNGLYCDGVEVCGGGACQPGMSPCSSGQICIESSDTCTLPDGGMDAGTGDACVPVMENCTNETDDDCDGLVDCADASCFGHSACIPDAGGGDACVAGEVAEICNNGVDDNCDGYVDCADPSCGFGGVCTDGGSVVVPDGGGGA